MARNYAYFANISLFLSKLLLKALKMKLYKTLIKLVLCYRTETWALSNADSNKLKIFERKVVRKIHGAVFEEESWRIKNKNEMV